MAEKFDYGYRKEGGLRIGRYREGTRKWEDYEIDKARATEESAEFLHSTIRNVSRELSEQVSRSNEATQLDFARSVGEAMREGSVSLSSSLQDLFAEQSNAMELQNDRVVDAVGDLGHAIGLGLDRLSHSIGIGFELLGERLDCQIQLTQKIASRLDGIHETLVTPELTRAREYHRRAESYVKNHLYVEAMEVIQKSEELEKVNPSLHNLKGLILLTQPGFRNLAAAEKEFQISVRYADAIKSDLPDELWAEVRDEAYRGLSKVAFLRSHDAVIDGDTEQATEYLHESIRLASQLPRSQDTRYMRATAAAVLGLDADALQWITELTDELPRYLADALSDPHFGDLRDELVQIPEKLHADPETLTHRIDVASARFGDLIKTVEAIEGLDQQAQADLAQGRRNLDALQAMTANVDEYRNNILNKTLITTDGLRRALQSAQGRLDEEARELRSRIAGSSQKEPPVEPEEEPLALRPKPTLKERNFDPRILWLTFLGFLIGCPLAVVLGFPAACLVSVAGGSSNLGYGWGFLLTWGGATVWGAVKGIKESNWKDRARLSENEFTLSTYERYVANAKEEHSRLMQARCSNYEGQCAEYKRFLKANELKDQKVETWKRLGAALQIGRKSLN